MSRTALPLTDLYAPIQEGLDRVVRLIDDELQSDLPAVNDLVTRLAAYRGKLLRPALLLLTAEAVDGIDNPHYVLAAVVELVHMATLVHDDVLDDARVRRRQPTLNATNGNTAAVMLGDFLISHAFHLCSGLDSQFASRLIGRTTNLVCEGELLQIDRRGVLQMTEGEYLEIVRRKTAVLTGASCALGARYAGGKAAVVTAMDGFGVQVGIAFQIIDDVLDVVGVPTQMGKTLGRDLELGELTLPVIHAVQTADESTRAELGRLLSERMPADRTRIAAMLTAAGSIAYATEVAQAFVGRALANLNILPDSPARASLAALAEFIIQREQ